MAVEATRQSFEAAEHTLSVNAGQSVWIEGDRARLVQVLTNLLTNAAKFVPQTSINLGGGNSGSLLDAAGLLGGLLTAGQASTPQPASSSGPPPASRR